MNPFQDTYYNRLLNWRHLRDYAEKTDLETALTAIDRWWQLAPLINHYLHAQDLESWPDPWTLLSENTYCLLTRALGIAYTLEMSRKEQGEILLVSDHLAEEHYLVSIRNAKYLLNFYPDTVISNTLDQFTVRKSISIHSVLQKIK